MDYVFKFIQEENTAALENNLVNLGIVYVCFYFFFSDTTGPFLRVKSSYTLGVRSVVGLILPVQ